MFDDLVWWFVEWAAIGGVLMYVLSHMVVVLIGADEPDFYIRIMDHLSQIRTLAE